uniref:Uncharacterized protein n=1 Tax=Cacopsylla melanoneura TaxID=428564 RepID=A0A8D8VJ65_9HEMI
MEMDFVHSIHANLQSKEERLRRKVEVVSSLISFCLILLGLLAYFINLMLGHLASAFNIRKGMKFFNRIVFVGPNLTKKLFLFTLVTFGPFCSVINKIRRKKNS